MSRKKKNTEQTAAPEMEQEVVLDPVEEVPEAEDTQEVIDVELLQKQLADAQAQQEEYLNLAQRVQADFENFRRRNNAVRAEAYDEGARAFAATLLPVIDNLERALQAAGEDSPLKEGVAMVLKQMLEAFEKRGITPIDRLGEVFDPNLENAVMQGSEDEGEPGTVCAVFQKGYQMDKHVLRYAMVKVVPQ
ncbi:MAG: nucleotide exchange factor GrpE [Clostridia bacterium]|nr:nucleotide exchange factor GrpE [Clostridia bacterium]